MTSPFIKVITHVRALPNREVELRHVLLQFVENRRQEKGCSSCELLQNHIDSTEFLILQHWESQARVKSEFSPDYFREAVEESTELLAEPIQISWYDFVEP